MSPDEYKTTYEAVLNALNGQAFILILPKVNDKNEILGQYVISNIDCAQCHALILKAAKDAEPNRKRTFIYDQENNQD